MLLIITRPLFPQLQLVSRSKGSPKKYKWFCPKSHFCVVNHVLLQKFRLTVNCFTSDNILILSLPFKFPPVFLKFCNLIRKALGQKDQNWTWFKRIQLNSTNMTSFLTRKLTWLFRLQCPQPQGGPITIIIIFTITRISIKSSPDFCRQRCQQPQEGCQRRAFQLRTCKIPCLRNPWLALFLKRNNSNHIMTNIVS